MFFRINRKGRFFEMKNKLFACIGVLLVFGFVLAGCTSNSPALGTTPLPKSLTVTGFPEPSVRTLVVITIRDGADPWDKPPLASAGAEVRAGATDCTFSLRVGEDPWNDGAVAWTGSGECLIWLEIYRNDQPNNQQSKTEYPFVGGTDDVKNFTFTNETPSVSFSFQDDFKEIWW
jgi:hypothetical protein